MPCPLSPQVSYLVSVSLCVAVIVAFQLTAFTFRENLAATALLLALFGYVMRNMAAELWFVFWKRNTPRDGFEPAASFVIFSLCKQLCCFCEGRAADQPEQVDERPAEEEGEGEGGWRGGDGGGAGWRREAPSRLPTRAAPRGFSAVLTLTLIWSSNP